MKSLGFAAPPGLRLLLGRRSSTSNRQPGANKAEQNSKTNTTLELGKSGHLNMCWQGFARFRCGHYAIHEETCEFANELDVPFWQKIQCPNYEAVSRRPALECGIGKFYCAQTDDGKYLDDIFRDSKLVEDRIANVVNVMETQIIPARDEIFARLSQECNGDRALMNQRAAYEPQMHSLQSAVVQARQERNTLLARKKAGDDTIYYARQFWQLHAHGIGITTGMPILKPPLPPHLRLAPMSNPQRNPPPAALQIAHGYVPCGNFNIPSVGQNMYVKPISAPLPVQPPRAPVQTAISRSQMEQQNAIPEVAAFTKRQQREQKIKEEKIVSETTDSVRRSTRATRKKINYAEDAHSEISSPSRTTSPVKTDDSGFSPSKSDASAAYEPSPVRRSAKDRASAGRTTRPRGSLGDIIKDWARTNAAGTPTPGRDAIAAGPRQSPAHRLSDSRQGTPDTVILPMDDQRADAPIGGAQQRSRRTNSSASNSMHQPQGSSQPAYGVPRGPILPPNFISVNPLTQTPPRFNFGLPTNLSHGPATPVLNSNLISKAPTPLATTSLVQYQTPTGMQDPTKRKISASVSPNKKVRLSLPGEDYGASASRTRKDSMTAPATPRADGTPAPVLAPPGARSAAGHWRKENMHPAEKVSEHLPVPSDVLFDMEMEASDVDWDLFDGRPMM